LEEILTRFTQSLSVLFLFLVAIVCAPAQTSKGTLTGVIRDSSGAVLVNASIHVKNSDTGEARSTTSSTLGAYRFDALTPGKYTLHVSSAGFEQFSATNLNVTASQVVSFDATLKPGRVDQTVSVAANDVLLNQENASLSASISAENMAELPIFSLNPIEVLTTVPGVQIVSNSALANGQEIQVSGARPRANNYMIDGQEINDAAIAGQAVQPQIPDMYSDAVIYTHNAPAEFGRASGGVVNLITKSGTNTAHGSAWELYDGSGLDSTDGQSRQILPRSRDNKARFDQHLFGFTAGAPIIRNKLFAFGAAQWSRYYGNETASQVDLPNATGVALLKTIAAGGNATTATNANLLLEYLSNASYLATFADFGGTTVKKSLGSACPVASPACVLQIDSFLRPATPEVAPDTQWTYRIDYAPATKDTFTARYLHDRASLTPDFFTNGTSLPGFDSMQGGPSELGQGSWTHIFSSSLVNEFRAAETRISFAFAPTAASLANPLYTAPTLSTGWISDLGFNQDFPQSRSQDMYQFQDTVAWTHGRHTVRAGADIGRRIEMDLNGLDLHGTLTFADGGSGSTAVGNFLLNQLGPSGSAQRQFGNPCVDPHSWHSGVFAQDDIKILPTFTFNLGIRWDYFTDPSNSLKFPAINPSSAATLYGPIDAVYKIADNKHSIAPRVGFAYTPRFQNWFGDGKTVIRAGFGIFFDPAFTAIAINSAGSAPNIASSELQSTSPNGLSGATGLIAQLTPQLTQLSDITWSAVNNLTTPYTPEWNLTVERELPEQFGLSVSYVGSRGIKLFANQQYNYFDFNSGNRISPTRGAISGVRGNFADSLYSGLEVGLRRNFNHGLALNAAYVYSKTLDDGSEVLSTSAITTSYSANLAPGGRGQDWGNSAYDHRQYAAFTYVWNPAGFRSESRSTDAVLSALSRHWTISGSSRFQSGAYTNVNYGGLDSNGDGSAYNDRPLVGNKHAAMSSVAIDGIYLGAPAAGTYYDLGALQSAGNYVLVNPSASRWIIPYGPQYLHQEVGRNSSLNPGMLNNDMALEKAFPARILRADKGQFVFRAEAENIANHNNVNLVDVNLLSVGTSKFMNKSNGREGPGTNLSGNRNIRFWAKYTF
jgi:hypothetical protein